MNNIETTQDRTDLRASDFQISLPEASSVHDVTNERQFSGSLRDLEREQRLWLSGHNSEQIEEFAGLNHIERETELRLGLAESIRKEQMALARLNRAEAKRRKLEERREEIRASVMAEAGLA